MKPRTITLLAPLLFLALSGCADDVREGGTAPTADTPPQREGIPSEVTKLDSDRMLMVWEPGGMRTSNGDRSTVEFNVSVDHERTIVYYLNESNPTQDLRFEVLHDDKEVLAKTGRPPLVIEVDARAAGQYAYDIVPEPPVGAHDLSVDKLLRTGPRSPAPT